jgi:spore maturation protein CgeB
LKIPYAAWLTDDPVTPEPPPPSPYLYLFVHEKGAIDEVKRMGYKNLYYLPLAANPKRYKKIHKGDERLRRHRCEVSFLGNAGSRWEDGYNQQGPLKRLLSQEMVERMIETLRSDPLQNIFELFFKCRGKDSIKDVSRLVKELEGSHPKKAYQIKEWLKPVKSESMKWYRRDIIKEIAEHREIHLYGDTAWRYLEENSKAVYHGKVYDIDAVVKIYNASKINIAVQSNVYNTGVNYRTFTIPACGGFMISDYRSELVELFEENKEVVHFRERGELIDLINYYLKHPKEREEIAQRARERVLREHTHRHRMGRILEVMKEVM